MSGIISIQKKFLVAIAGASIFLSVIASTAVAVVLRPAATRPYPFLDMEARAEADRVTLTVTNNWDREIKPAHIVIEAIRNETIEYVARVDYSIARVVNDIDDDFKAEAITSIDAPTKNIYLLTRVEYTQAGMSNYIPNKIVYNLEELRGKCCPDCKECVLDITFAEWNPEATRYTLQRLIDLWHGHEVGLTQVVGSVTVTGERQFLYDVEPEYTWVVDDVDVANGLTVVCYQVFGLYRVEGSLQPAERVTFEIALDKIWGCLDGLIEGEWVVITVYEDNGSFLGQVLVQVV